MAILNEFTSHDEKRAHARTDSRPTAHEARPPGNQEAPAGRNRADRREPRRREPSMLPPAMKTKASHDGLFCELYWGTTRNEAWNFGPEQTRVLAAPDETVALPLYGFTLPEE